MIFFGFLCHKLPVIISLTTTHFQASQKLGMTANSDQFKAFLIDKIGANYTNEKKQLSNEDVQLVPSVKLQGITTDDCLTFNEHISNMCKSAANQLNALIRLKTFLSSNERKVLVNSFVLSSFNYCPLVWFVSSFT